MNFRKLFQIPLVDLNKGNLFFGVGCFVPAGKIDRIRCAEKCQLLSLNESAGVPLLMLSMDGHTMQQDQQE
ncbi:MAG: hypothetical protein ABR94_00495 [Sphingobacteriales bacterium BACL12 MAG-120802-bin5]|nr:MAG: hypothetical protein ABR94_00495 [Sphingobacteriales bacterium BACL12 MAG-120802-bin5]